MINHDRTAPATAEPVDTDALPLTQILLLEMLAARHRTGETLFAVTAKAVKAASALQKLGLVWFIDGNVEGSIRAALTEAGVRATISTTYVTPIERELKMVSGQLKELRELRALEAEHRSGPNW